MNLCLLLASGFYLYYSLTHYRLGTLRMPREGFMPLILGVGMVVLSGFLTAQAFLGKGDAGGVMFPIQWWRLGLIIASSLLYATMMQWLGYPLSTFLFLICIFKFSRMEGWLKPAALSILTAAAFTLLFKTGLGVMLPTGFIGL